MQRVRLLGAWVGVWLALAVLLSQVSAGAVSAISGSSREYNGSVYCLLSASNWPDAEAFAEGWGGHLVAINDASENAWVWDTYALLKTADYLWIGLFQPDGSPEPDGGWQWADGSPLSFTAWAPSEPNNAGEEKYAHLQQGPTWNDASLNFWASCQGVVEAPAWEPFADIAPDFWASAAVKACLQEDIVKGYADGWYHPEGEVRRSQMAVFLARALAEGDVNVPTGPAVATFSDVPSSGFGENGTEPYWAYKYIEYVAEQRVAMGFPDGIYQPEWVVNRGQMAAFISRAMVPQEERPALSGYTPPATPSFTDVPPEFAFYKGIEYLADQQVVRGYQDGTYHPEWPVNRGQMAVFVAAAFHLIP